MVVRTTHPRHHLALVDVACLTQTVTAMAHLTAMTNVMKIQQRQHQGCAAAARLMKMLTIMAPLTALRPALEARTAMVIPCKIVWMVVMMILQRQHQAYAGVVSRTQTVTVMALQIATTDATTTLRRHHLALVDVACPTQ